MVAKVDRHNWIDEQYSAFFQLFTRDEGARFSPKEKALLAKLLMSAWAETEFDRESMVVPLQDVSSIGHYVDGEPKGSILVTPAIKVREQLAQRRSVYWPGNIQTSDDVLVFRGLTRWMGFPSSTLISAYFPLMRGDRANQYDLLGEKEELILLKEHIADLLNSNVQRAMVIDPHSPVFALLCLLSGIPTVNLTALPMLFNMGIEKGLINGSTNRIVSGDDGSTERGLLTYLLAQEKGIECAPLIVGNKIKRKGKTSVTFTEEQLSSIEGQTVLIPEDIISTGGTLAAVIDMLFKRGHIKEAIILAAFPIMAGNAVEKLANVDGVKVIMTDGRTPINSTAGANNFFTAPLTNTFQQLAELDKRGLNPYSEEGRKELRKLGLDIDPWITFN